MGSTQQSTWILGHGLEDLLLVKIDGTVIAHLYPMKKHDPDRFGYGLEVKVYAVNSDFSPVLQHIPMHWAIEMAEHFGAQYLRDEENDLAGED